MDIDKNNINNETKKIDLVNLIKLDKKTNAICDVSTKTNLWIPTNYNNNTNNAFGTTVIKDNGQLQFHFKTNNSSYSLFTKTIKISLLLKSNNLIKYDLFSSNSCNTIEKDTNNINLYHLTITNNEAVYTINIKNADTLKWEIKTENNEMIEFHLTFTPNYLDILQQKINEANVLSSKLKNHNRIIKNLQFKINEIKNQIKEDKLKEQEYKFFKKDNKKLQNTVKDLEQKIKNTATCLSILKIEEANKRLQNKKNLSKLQLSNKECNKLKYIHDETNRKLIEKTNECNLLKTSIDKYRVENKKIIVDLNNLKKENESLQFHNSNSIKDNYYLKHEINELNSEISVNNKKIKTLNDLVHDLELENANYKIDVEELTIQRDKMIDEYDSKMNEHEEQIIKLKEQNNEIRKENEQHSKDLTYTLEEKDHLQNELIDCKLTITELELNNECLMNKKKSFVKLDLLSKVQEIFDWYKQALPDKKKINNIMVNLESEVISTINESK